MNTTAAIPIARSTPLWQGDQLVGFMDLESCDHGTFMGVLTLQAAWEGTRQLFESAVAAEKGDGQASAHGYQAAWHAWQQACQQLQRLDLSFGDLHIPIEGFAVDADWRVEFESALWWDVLTSPSFVAAKSPDRWR